MISDMYYLPWLVEVGQLELFAWETKLYQLLFMMEILNYNIKYLDNQRNGRYIIN